MLCAEEAVFLQSVHSMAKDSENQLTLDLSEADCLDAVLPLRELQEAFAHP
jgi:hypothetical protein